MDLSRLKFYEQEVNPVVDSNPAVCTHHPQLAADILCADCEHLFCWACTAYDSGQDELLCRDCLAQRAAASKRRRWLRILRTPAVYVVAAVLIALIFTLRNRREENSVPTQEAPDKPWYQREAGALWLRQAVRTRQRAEFLASAGYSSEAQHWAELSRAAFGKAAGVWHDAPIAVDLAAADALSLELASGPEAALAAMRQIQDQLPRDEDVRLAWLFHIGRLALAASQPEQAAAAWLPVLRQTTPERIFATAPRLLDDMIDLLSGGMQEGTLRLAMRQLGGLNMSRSDMRQQVLAAIRNHQIAHLFPRDAIPAEFIRGKTTKAGEAADDLTIEHF